MEKELSANESLQIITQAIKQAKKNAGGKEGSFQIIWWGWVAALANFGHYLLNYLNYENAPLVWMIMIPAGIVSGIYGYRTRKNARVSSHMDRVYSQIWFAVFIVIMISLVFMRQIEYYHNPIILAVAGVGMYTTGVLIRFKPIIYGAIVLWLGSVIAFNVSVMDQNLVAGITLCLGYLIPGYLLKNEKK